MKTEDTFFRDLLATVPELAAVYKDHIEFNEELLGYLALGDMSQHLLRAMQAGAPEQETLSRYCCFLEEAFDGYGATVHDMIRQSFLEFVEGLAVEAPELYPSVYLMLGPNLRSRILIPAPKDIGT